MATPTQLTSLREALYSSCHPLFCSGTISPSQEGLYLYYGKKDAKFIDFASATPKDLDLISAACSSATFSCRTSNGPPHKAAKTDASYFSAQLDLVGSGLIRAIGDQFLQGGKDKVGIRAEPYKLSVSDKDSSDEKREDTSRGTNVLGSLVMIYPTACEGGELVLRQEHRKWTFDAKLSTASQTSPSLSWVAFRSEVEHEVLEVISGCRVTVTYNLYLSDPASEPGASALTINSESASNFQTQFQSLLESPEFLPEGGTLGFGLDQPYSITFQTKLKKLANCLKGEDARVYQACRELRLQPLLRMIYYDAYEHTYGIMMDRVVRKDEPSTYFNYHGLDGQAHSYEGALVKSLGGVPVNKREGANIADSEWVSNEDDEYEDYEKTKGVFITWISQFNEQNRVQDIKVLPGDRGDGFAVYIYGTPCIIVHVPAASVRV